MVRSRQIPVSVDSYAMFAPVRVMIYHVAGAVEGLIQQHRTSKVTGLEQRAQPKQ